LRRAQLLQPRHRLRAQRIVIVNALERAKSDILWRDSSGNVAIWFMNGAQASGAGVGSVPTNWTIAGTTARATFYGAIRATAP
jgi:hypothetical protein